MKTNESCWKPRKIKEDITELTAANITCFKSPVLIDDWEVEEEIKF